MEIQKYYIDDKETLVFTGTVNAVTYYGYNTTFGASAAPVWQESKCLTLFFYTDISTKKLSFMAIASQHDDDIDGDVSFTVSGFPSTSELVVQDDQGEASFDPSTGTVSGIFKWVGCCTDGLAMDNINGFENLTLEITSKTNIDQIKIISSDYSTKYIDIGELPFNIASESKIVTINDYLNPSIPPGIYPTSQTVYFDFDSEVSSVLSTVDDNPTLAKYIAYDNLDPANPFIATVQDGKGNVLFDGGFPKFYNRDFDITWSVFSDMSASFKYLANAMDFIANLDKVSQGNKNILVLGDSNIGENYNINETGDTDFRTGFEGVASIMGYTLTYKTREDYTSGYLDTTLIELNNYCGVILMSSGFNTEPLITDLAVTNLLLFRESGNGIFIISDHGLELTDIETAGTFPYSNRAFFCTANKLIVNFGSYFSGDYDRTNVNVGFLRDTYGDHPLYNNLSDSEDIYAGGSESKINIPETISYSIENFPSETLSDGYSQLNVMVVLTNGNIINRSYTYGINVPEIIHLYDNNKIDYPSSFDLDTNPLVIDLDISYDQTLTENMFGYFQYNDIVIGEIDYDGTTTTINYYDGYDGTLNILDGDIIKIIIISPIEYQRTFYISIPLQITDYRKLSMLVNDIIRDNNVLENISFNSIVSNFNDNSSVQEIGDNNEKYMILLSINNKSKTKFYYKYPKLIKDIQNGII
jgi:hypothetical protein